MVKVIMGLKGSGKTKALIDMVNTAVKEDNGNVVCVEKGSKLTFDISHQARLIDISQFEIKTYESFLAFISGLFAGNNDITSLYVDSIMKFCPDDMKAFGNFLEKLDVLSTDKTVVITVSHDTELTPPDVKKYF